LDWEPKHVTIGLFEPKGTYGVSLVGQLQALFEYKFINKIICHMKDEGINRSTMTNALKHIITCGELGMQTPFEGVCFGHALFKVRQYATSNEKISSSLQLVSIKTT
jgi:hypothetical protein